MKTRITQTYATRVKSPATGNQIHYDSEIPGFGLRVTAKGAKSFILNYVINGRERRYTIGGLGRVHSGDGPRKGGRVAPVDTGWDRSVRRAGAAETGISRSTGPRCGHSSSCPMRTLSSIQYPTNGPLRFTTTVICLTALFCQPLGIFLLPGLNEETLPITRIPERHAVSGQPCSRSAPPYVRVGHGRR